MSQARVSVPPLSEFAQDVRTGLSRPGQKEIPSQYLYDELGSALFDAITCLPEYGLTRAGERLLRQNASTIRDLISGPTVIAELGSGNGKKTRYVLEAFAGARLPTYFPIDVSKAALTRCRQELAGLAEIQELERSYLDGLDAVARRRDPGHRLLVLFLGSTIGNFDRKAAVEFLRELRLRLQPGDALLLGADLVKPLEQMLLAYDDPTGVTGAFNRNVLGHINRELDANFDLRQFDHEVRYNQTEQRIEMHLVSRVNQTVSIPKADLQCSLRQGETIWTEASHKFLLEELPIMAANSGFDQLEQWVDKEWPFAQSLWIAAGEQPARR